MRRSRWYALAIIAPTLLALTLGCGGGDKDKDKKTGDDSDKDKGGEVSSGDLKPVEIKGRGMLKGKVVVNPKPDIEALNKEYQKTLANAQQDKEHCMKQEGENTQQTWLIGEGDGLANVIVWVAPPKDHYFNLQDSDRDLKTLGIAEVVVDQPHCAYTPRVFTLFPSYYDPKTKKYEKTGQVFKVTNSGDLKHNTTWAGTGIRGDNKMVTPKVVLDIPPTQVTASGLKPSPNPVNLTCQVHGWMRGYARGFDHPFVKVTDKNGNFEIKNVPAGTKLRVMYWHESMDKPAELKEITIMDKGDATEDITIKGK